MSGETSRQKENHICTGLLAHVDAGKTTLSESILYQCGVIRKLGRVDHKDAFLDTYDLERARGITIFSKQAEFTLGDKRVTLLDTPGHVDFSAEMERTLQILDYAILVVSGADQIQGHIQTLWRLLKQYEIPVFLFVNKMDQEGTDKEQFLRRLKEDLDSRCVDFSECPTEGQAMEAPAAVLEEIAVCDEDLLERYLEEAVISVVEVRSLIGQRKIFPCYFGSALKNQGVDRLLQGFDFFTLCRDYPEDFGARIFKIARDEQGNRLTYMKITGGSLKVKTLLSGKLAERQADRELTADADRSDTWEEKVDQIRVYSGTGYEMKKEVAAGAVCAVTGLTKTVCGEGLGYEDTFTEPVLAPVLTYQILLPDGADVHTCFLKLRQLEEEEPMLHIIWKEQTNEIQAQVMGAVQMEVLQKLVWDRFGLEISFGKGSIVYKETITDTVEGVGHFEPLRHYAEVHLLLDPTGLGSGLTFECDCSEDLLDKNWQRLIYTHLTEKRHKGVLTGGEITDMKITLKAGKAHQKHTVGGDFRQATYRAIRQGLMQAQSVLLEPVYQFRLELPSELTGRAMTDIQRMHGSFESPVIEGDQTVLTGCAPVAAMADYQMEVTAYSSGQGRLYCSLKGYAPCQEQETVVQQLGYDPDSDVENPSGSVFCAHGAGFVVPWNQVADHMHLESVLEPAHPQEDCAAMAVPERRMAGSLQTSWQMEKELQEIFDRTYGGKKDSDKMDRKRWARRVSADGASASGVQTAKRKPGEKEYLLVDGYNIIFAWDELKELAEENIEAARNKLMDILCNYQGYKGMTLILVYDAYKVKGNPGEIFSYHNIYVVYTKEAETADMYIEKTVHEMGRKHNVTVATSDGLEQVIVLGAGAQRMSAQGLWQEIMLMEQELQQTHLRRADGSKNYLFDRMPEEMLQLMEDVRLGKKDIDGRSLVK